MESTDQSTREALRAVARNAHGDDVAGNVVSKADLRTAHDMARLSSWEWRLSTNEVVIFHALPESALSAGVVVSFDELLAHVRPSERDQLSSDLTALAKGGNPSTARFRYDLPSGEAWLESRYEAVRDSRGKIVAVRGTTQDVTHEESEARLAASGRTFLQSTLDSLPHSVAVLGVDGEILLTNRNWKAFFTENGGLETPGQENYLDACDAAAGDPWADSAGEGLRALLANPLSPEFTLEYPCHSPDQDRWFALRAVRHEGSEDAAAVVSQIDITDRRNAEKQMRFQASLVDAANASLVATDGDGAVTHWSHGAQRLHGWTSAEAIGRKLSELILPSDGTGVSELDAARDRDGPAEEHLLLVRRDGSIFPALVTTSPLDDESSGGCIFVSLDITDRVAARQELLRARNHLRAVTDSMTEGLFTLDAEGRVTYMNQATERLLGWSRHDVIGRVWDNLAGVRGRDTGQPVALVSAITVAQGEDGVVYADNQTFVHRRGHELPVAYTASPFETEDGAGGCVVVFTDISERKARERTLLAEQGKRDVIDRIEAALADGRFVLHAQPILELSTGRITQNELLLRMVEPSGEICAPTSFLGVAEQSGLIRDIDRWVIAEGLKLVAAGNCVQINLSARSIGDLATMEHIERCLKQCGASPSNVVFEMTETAILSDEPAAIAFAERLHEIGCKLALDDFGTGFGSFTYLKRLPVDYLKIDIEFVRDITTNASSRHVVSAVVALARSFGLQTIAEGVEDAETKRALVGLGVDYAQGYHVGRPKPAAQIFEGIAAAVA